MIGSVAPGTLFLVLRFAVIVEATLGNCGELHRHIDRGSCDQLDPLRDQELGTVMRSDDYIMPLIQAGKWGEVTRDSAVRHKLTMMCSICGQSYYPDGRFSQTSSMSSWRVFIGQLISLPTL